MTKTRLEAFSDGVIAILITIMVLELKTPHEPSWIALRPLLPVFTSYLLSFIYIGIYWGNHHHLLHTVKEVNSKIIWGNMHLLFWLSLIPFTTAWMGESNFSTIPVAVYASLATGCGMAYYILLRVIYKSNPGDQELLIPLEKQSRKGLLSLIAYLCAIPAAFILPGLSCGLFVLVAATWLIPDRNIERKMKHSG